MGYIRGEAREQTTMFPVTLDELIPARPHVSGDRGIREPAKHGEAGFHAGKGRNGGGGRF